MKLSYDDFKLLNKLALQNSPKETHRVVSKDSLHLIVSQPYQVVFGTELYPTTLDKIFCTYFLLVKKHCFANGNKRTALLYLLTSLEVLGLTVQDPNSMDTFTEWVATLPYTTQSYGLVCTKLKHEIKLL